MLHGVIRVHIWPPAQVGEFRLLLSLLGSSVGTAAFCLTKCADRTRLETL
jgi:hypothetical protein